MNNNQKSHELCYNLKMKYRHILKFFLTLLSTFILSGCSQTDYFKVSANKHNLDYQILAAIASVESNYKSNAINVNESLFDVQRGAHYFDNWFTANLYMDTVLDPLGLNYDVGLCQINKIHFDRFDLDNEDLLEDETNIEIAARIYKWNLNKCRGNIRCALSMYNTGKANSKRGMRYADKVLRKKYKIFGTR